MNIHPLFVHFPIALLVVYSVLELGSYFISLLRRQKWIFSVKAFLLFTGVLTAFVALVTGGIAEDLVAGVNPRAFILEVHSPFAIATTVLYSILAATYIIRLFDQNGWGNYIAGLSNPFIRIWSLKKYGAYLILDTWFLLLLVTLALIGMLVTGALGAALVYGPNADPFISFIYHLFWAQ